MRLLAKKWPVGRMAIALVYFKNKKGLKPD
jgi:hypothetical protein